jgi:hypothetical protein
MLKIKTYEYDNTLGNTPHQMTQVGTSISWDSRKHELCLCLPVRKKDVWTQSPEINHNKIIFWVFKNYKIYSGGSDRRISVQGQPGQTVSEILSQKPRYTVVPATQETEVGGYWLEASPGKSSRPYLGNKRKGKGLWVWPSGRVLQALNSISSTEKEKKKIEKLKV